VGARDGDFSRENKVGSRKSRHGRGLVTMHVYKMRKGTVMASRLVGNKDVITVKYKVCDKVGLPCARLLSIRQYPTCFAFQALLSKHTRFGNEARAVGVCSRSPGCKAINVSIMLIYPARTNGDARAKVVWKRA